MRFGLQFLLPLTTWMPPCERTGVTAFTAGQSRRMASTSSVVSVTEVPDPALTPPELMATGVTISTSEPMFAILAAICSEAPAPISIIAMTDAMPMTMPSIVRMERRMLRRRAFSAVRTTWIENMAASLLLEHA